MFPKNHPLPRYEKEFSRLGRIIQETLIKIQEKYPSYWWNPYCKTECLGHKKIHKYSFESYVEGWVKGYFGFDSVKEMRKDLGEIK